MDKFLGFKTEEILTCLLLFAVGYFIAKMFSGCGCNDGFSVGGKKRNKYKLKSEDIFIPLTNKNIHIAVNLWTTGRKDDAMTKYGDIKGWDTSKITSMNNLFSGKFTFNEDISGWDTGNVTEMHQTFYFAEEFNADISRWDTSKVTDMNSMFYHAIKFDQDISGWDVSHVTDMFGMFNNAREFDQDISRWDVSKVTNMSWMFTNAKKFNADINCWEVDIASVNTDNMFTSSKMSGINPISKGCWDKESDKYNKCREYCNPPAPPPPPPPSPPSPTPTPTPTPPAPPAPPALQALCDPRGARPQLCPGQIPCPQCGIGRTVCPCPFYNE